MPCFAALDVSQETTAICVVDDNGTIIAETKIATCPGEGLITALSVCQHSMSKRSRAPTFCMID